MWIICYPLFLIVFIISFQPAVLIIYILKKIRRGLYLKKITMNWNELSKFQLSKEIWQLLILFGILVTHFTINKSTIYIIVYDFCDLKKKLFFYRKTPKIYTLYLYSNLYLRISKSYKNEC